MVRRVVHSQENLPQGIAGVWIPIDVNADGHLDLIQMRNLFEGDSGQCANGLPNCVGYLVWFGTGKGAFDRIQVVPLALPLDVHELDAIDLNDDGRKDLVVALSGTGTEAPWVQGSIMVAHALPTGGLGPLKMVHAGYNNYSGSITFADINGDGISDSIMSPQQSKPPEIRLRSLDNTFGSPGYLFRYLLLPSVIVAEDFDGDRRADLVSTQIVGFGALGLVYYHQSNGNLDPPTYTQFPWLASSSPSNYDYIKAGDLNGDGCKDIVMAAGLAGLLFFDGSNCTVAPHYRPDETGYVRRKPVGG
ncbi:MAG: FG-GAP repeat domain-containing protein [Pseudoxanthomonas sp.]